MINNCVILTAFVESVNSHAGVQGMGGQWDAARGGAGITYNADGYTVGTSASNAARSQNHISSGKRYAEFKCNWSTRYGPVVGVMDANATGFSTVNSFAMWVSEASLITASGSSSYGSGLVSGDVLGILLDMDAKQITFFKNGVSMGLAATNIPAGEYYFFAQSAGSAYPSTVIANFGASPFM